MARVQGTTATETPPFHTQEGHATTVEAGTTAQHHAASRAKEEDAAKEAEEKDVAKATSDD